MRLALLIPCLCLHPLWLFATAPVDCLKTVCVYSYDGHTLAAGLGLDNAPLPPRLRRATLAQEDRTFYRHHGVDPGRLWGALLHSQGRGASTITQQLVKNVFTGPRKSLWRKYVEAIYALRVEREFTKDQILLLYANIAQTGPGLFGFRAGARAYFGKEPGELTEAEAMFLVDSLPSPVRWTRWMREGKPMPEVSKRWLVWKLEWIEPHEVAEREAGEFQAAWGGGNRP